MRHRAERCRDSRASFAGAALVALLALPGAAAVPRSAAADDAGAADGNHLTPWNPCDHCNLLLGIGATYQLWGWSDGFVLPMTLELDDSRWEVGAFRFARTQLITGRTQDVTAANPYWGFTAMRRWQFLHRPWGRLYFGFGANYRTETDYVESTRLNFAYLIAARFGLGDHGSLVELGIRHWSNAWIKEPNRGQDFVTLSVSF
jgi:Lipid A 3-O-deacylase (PagL)